MKPGKEPFIFYGYAGNVMRIELVSRSFLVLCHAHMVLCRAELNTNGIM